MKNKNLIARTHIIYFITLVGVFFLIGYPFVYWTVRLEEKNAANTYLESHYMYLKNLYFEASMFWGIFLGYMMTILYLDYMFFSSFIFTAFGAFMFVACMFVSWGVFFPKITKGWKLLKNKQPISEEKSCQYQ